MGRMEWVAEIGGLKVVRDPVPGGTRGGLVKAPSFCIHTTEGSTLEGARATIHQTGYAPHFTVGEGKIVQQRPLDTTGSALRAHNDRFWQVECVGFSSIRVHQLTPSTWRPLVILARWIHGRLGVPLVHPWSDQLPPFPASDNERRRDGDALTRRGFYGHVDVPDQEPTWHWDPGSLDYSALFKEIREGGDDDVLNDKQKEALEFAEGVQLAAEGAPEPKDPGPRRRGWRWATKVQATPEAPTG